MDIRDFETLIAISEVGSLEAAGRSLGVTAAAVSQRLSRMEDLAGRQFVIRSQPARLTDAGAAMVRAGRQIRFLIEEATAEPDRASRPIKVAVHHDSLASWFIPAFVGFHRHTGRTIEVIAADHSETRDLMRAGQAAAAVSSDPDALPGCVATPLGRLDYVAVVARHKVDAAVWTTLPVLCFDRQDSPTARSLPVLGLSGPSRSFIPSVHDLHAALLSGAGWAVMPYPVVARDLAAGRLEKVAPEPTLTIDLFLHMWRTESRDLQILEREVLAAFKSISESGRSPGI